MGSEFGDRQFPLKLPPLDHQPSDYADRARKLLAANSRMAVLGVMSAIRWNSASARPFLTSVEFKSDCGAEKYFAEVFIMEL